MKLKNRLNYYKSKVVPLLLIFLSIGCGNPEEKQQKDNTSNKATLTANNLNAYSESKNIEFSSDFDFLIGEWEITSKQLKKRLSNNNEWTEKKAHSKCWKILNGYGNMDEFSMPTSNGKPYVGNTVRVFNPETKEWSLYWVDNYNLHLGLTYQTKGKFENGIGTFYGEEMFEGKKVKQKFTWKKIDDNTSYWDQAYFDESKNDWEINWTMEFKRINK